MSRTKVEKRKMKMVGDEEGERENLEGENEDEEEDGMR